MRSKEEVLQAKEFIKRIDDAIELIEDMQVALAEFYMNDEIEKHPEEKKEDVMFGTGARATKKGLKIYRQGIIDDFEF